VRKKYSPSYLVLIPYAVVFKSKYKENEMKRKLNEVYTMYNLPGKTVRRRQPLLMNCTKK
jgi:hypothetical protein